MKKDNSILGTVLAGGRGRRFGRDKSFIGMKRAISTLESLFGGAIILGMREAEKYRHIQVVEDVIPDKGPLGGIYSGLMYADVPYIFVCACDMPFVQKDAVKKIAQQGIGYDAALPRAWGRQHPLCALYSKTCLPVIKGRIKKNCLKVMDIFCDLNVAVIDMDEYADSFININTQEEYERQFRQRDRLS